MTGPETSPEYTVTFGPGVAAVFASCLRRLAETARGEHEATSYEELAQLRGAALQQAHSFLNAFVGGVLNSNRYDGNLQLSVDGPESLFFRYDSGYHGAMILHANGEDPRTASWSVHT